MEDIFLLPTPEEKNTLEEAIKLSDNEALEAEKNAKNADRKTLIRVFSGIACIVFLALSVYCTVFEVGYESVFGGILDKNVFAKKVLTSFLYHKATPAAGDDTNTGDNTDTPASGWFNDNTDSGQNTSLVPFSPENIYDFDTTDTPEGYLSIIPYNLTQEEDGILRISNETAYNPDLEQLSLAAPVNNTDLVFTNEEPVVLILHTHGTEAFSKEGVNYYSDNYNIPRSSDITENIVSVGSVMAQVLNSNGIPTLHCQIMHDIDSYKDSYSRSAETIKKYLKEYPSIKYIFDVHRDSVLTSDGTKIRPVTAIDGKSVAQVMTVVGTDYFGAYNPFWETNLTLAAKLQTELNGNYRNFARSINLRGAAFNQCYSTGSLLLEIGSCGNTLEEAKLAGEIVAEELAKLILSGW